MKTNGSGCWQHRIVWIARVGTQNAVQSMFIIWDLGIVYCTCGHFLCRKRAKSQIHQVYDGPPFNSWVRHQERTTSRTWHFARASQWNVVVLEFWSPCLPQFFHELSHRQASWNTWRSFCNATVSLPSCPDLSGVCSTLRLLLSSDEHVWTLITSCVIPRFPDLSEEQSSSLKEFTLISWERDFFLSSWTTITSCVIPALIYHELDLELDGLVGKILLVEQLLLLAVEQLPLLVVDQLSNPMELPSSQSWRSEIFGGSRGDRCAFLK